MRRTLVSSIALLAFLAAPAAADVEVFANINKFKDKSISETILKDKAAFIQVQVMPDVGKFGESDLQVNQSNDGNTITETETKRTDTINASANTNSGVLSVNQAAGNLNNQGNALSAAVAQGGGAATFGEAQANVDQSNGSNPLISLTVAERDALIQDSLNGNTGVTQANQSVGNVNNQTNALSMTVTLGSEGGVILTEADLGQSNLGGVLSEINMTRTAVLTGSVLGNTGITGVNQASGNFANQGTVVAFGAAVIQ